MNILYNRSKCCKEFEIIDSAHATCYMREVTDGSVWQQAAECPPVFQFAMRWHLCVLVQCIAVNIRFLLTIFKEGPRNFFSYANLCYM